MKPPTIADLAHTYILTAWGLALMEELGIMAAAFGHLTPEELRLIVLRALEHAAEAASS